MSLIHLTQVVVLLLMPLTSWANLTPKGQAVFDVCKKVNDGLDPKLKLSWDQVNDVGFVKELIGNKEFLGLNLNLTVENPTPISLEDFKQILDLPLVKKNIGRFVTEVVFGNSHLSFQLRDFNNSLGLMSEYLGQAGEAQVFKETIIAYFKTNQLGLLLMRSAYEKGSSSQIADIESTKPIRNLTQINGVSIAVLERIMRPGSDSQAGFLGHSEKLLDVLATDNNLVVGSLKTSHAALAKPLEDIVGLAGYDGGVIEYNGTKFEVRVYSFRGVQDSPFKDNQATNKDFEVKNLNNGASIKFSGLLPHFIKTYGFYEGYETSYRLPPTDILEVFSWLRQ